MNINELPIGLMTGLLMAVISILTIKIKKKISDKAGVDIDAKTINIEPDNKNWKE